MQAKQSILKKIMYIHNPCICTCTFSWLQPHWMLQGQTNACYFISGRSKSASRWPLRITKGTDWKMRWSSFRSKLWGLRRAERWRVSHCSWCAPHLRQVWKKQCVQERRRWLVGKRCLPRDATLFQVSVVANTMLLVAVLWTIYGGISIDHVFNGNVFMFKTASNLQCFRCFSLWSFLLKQVWKELWLYCS